VASLSRNRGEPDWKKHSREATENGQPAKNRHEQLPTSRPNVVCAHNSKTGDEDEYPRHEDERRLVGKLIHQCREGADPEVEQHSGSYGNKCGADKAGDRLRGSQLTTSVIGSFARTIRSKLANSKISPLGNRKMVVADWAISEVGLPRYAVAWLLAKFERTRNGPESTATT
jgi:hypothetical protein